MNSISAPPGIGIGTVVAVSIVIGLIVFFANKYSADQNYVSLDSNASGAFQPKGNYVTVAQYDPVIKSLKDSTDMLSQQVKTSTGVTSNLFRSIGIIRISPNTILLSPATSGLTTGFAGLPSCIGPRSPLAILSGSPAFVNKIMAYKDTNPSATILQAALAAVKSIGTESFRFRRQQTISGSVGPYSTQLEQWGQTLPKSDISSLSSDNKTLLSKFAAKYFYTITSFDAITGYPIVENLTDMFQQGPSKPDPENPSATIPPKPSTTLSPSSAAYQTIVSDIYRYNPLILNSC